MLEFVNEAREKSFYVFKQKEYAHITPLLQESENPVTVEVPEYVPARQTKTPQPDDDIIYIRNLDTGELMPLD
jgi:hypothetical protein